MNKNKISVIMSTYNSENTLENAIESIISQKYSNFELLIIDDCSNDSTYSICTGYKKKYKNIRVYRNNENLGLTKSLNILIKHSTGDFIARHDSDDVSHIDRLSIQMKFIKKNKLDACTSRAKIMNSNRVIPGKSYYLPINFHMKLKNPFIHGTLLINKNALQAIGGYNENFVFAQDYKLMSDLISNGYKVKIQNKILYYINMKDNISSQFKNQQKYYADCVKNNIIPTEFK